MVKHWLIGVGVVALCCAAFRTPVLDRVICSGGYTATVFANGLSSPDGLAFDANGQLLVAEETAGRISRIDQQGQASTILQGLHNPEGIAVGPDGTVYAVEDVANGRVVARSPDGTIHTIASNLTAPEGIVWSQNRLVITESNVELIGSNFTALRTWVTAINPSSGATEHLAERTDRSYSGIAADATGALFVANELSGAEANGLTLPVRGVFNEPANTPNSTPFAAAAITPEGLRFGTNGTFPLYVAEESPGRISTIAADGSVSTLCSGFMSIEDVILDSTGRMFVSEDGSGSIILLAPPVGEPTIEPTSKPTSEPTAEPSPTPEHSHAFIPLISNAP